jgi:hypothetical protein
MLGKWLYVNDTGNRLAAIPLSRIIGSSGKVIAVFDDLPDQLVRSGVYQYSDYSPRGDQPGTVSGALSVSSRPKRQHAQPKGKALSQLATSAVKLWEAEKNCESPPKLWEAP